ESIFSIWQERDGVLRCLSGRVLFSDQSVSLSQPQPNDWIIRMSFADPLQCVTRLFGGKLSASAIAGSQLECSQGKLERSVHGLSGSSLEASPSHHFTFGLSSSQSGLHQSTCFAVVSFKRELSNLAIEDTWSLRRYL